MTPIFQKSQVILGYKQLLKIGETNSYSNLKFENSISESPWCTSDCTVTMHGILCYSTMRSEVNVSEVTETQLIHYHPEKDLLPMILANSNYSFKYREGGNIGYDFASIQSELEDRFFSAKSRINTATVNIYSNLLAFSLAMTSKICGIKIIAFIPCKQRRRHVPSNTT